jgi:tRNA U38,U39,U40 pseudouridine synthase TruA
MAIERRCPVKTMRLHFSEGEQLVPLIESSPLHSSMRIYNLVFEAEAFLYKLIRRITGTLVHIAKGQMTTEDVLNRFACPPDYYDSSLPVTLPPNGLFLHEVKYNEQDFLNPPLPKTDVSTLDDIEDVIMEIQDDDEEDDLELNSKMVATR